MVLVSQREVDAEFDRIVYADAAQRWVSHAYAALLNARVELAKDDSPWAVKTLRMVDGALDSLRRPT